MPFRIAHSHNTDHLTKNPLKYALNELARKNITKYATHLFACSQKAGEWLFGERSFTVIHNAVPLQKFAFDPQKRYTLRKKYDLSENNFVVGHVGRFDAQKNHSFLLDVFASYVKRNPAAKLVLIGDGALRKEIEDKIAALALGDKVLLLGTCANVNELYNIMDVFVLPSKFEGLPVVALEAQASGLYCLFSEGVPLETAVIDQRAEFLCEDVTAWEKALIGSENTERIRTTEEMKQAGYDIIKESEKLQAFYLRLQEQAFELG